MNIYASKGHKVRLREGGENAGYDGDKKAAKEYLEPGKIYTVEYTNVSSSWSQVKLREFPNHMFNTVHFEDVSAPKFEDQFKHPDWLYYSGAMVCRRFFDQLNIYAIAEELGYGSREMYQKISAWRFANESKKARRELKKFEKKALAFLEGTEMKEAKAELSNYIKLCLSKMTAREKLRRR
jgi:hypothetical protein